MRTLSGRGLAVGLAIGALVLAACGPTRPARTPSGSTRTVEPTATVAPTQTPVNTPVLPPVVYPTASPSPSTG